MKNNSKAKLKYMLHRSVIFLLLPLAACTATRAPVYPKATPLTIVVSKGTVDLNTEVPGDDYLIPDSQVFVGGRNSQVTSAIAGGFGVLGAAIGISINRSRNASGLEGTEDLFRLSFASLQADAFLRAADNRAAGRYAPMKVKTAPHLVFTPHVRMSFKEEEDAYLVYQTKVSFLDGETASEKGKHFYYSDFERRRILGDNGWAADNAKAMKAQTDKSMAIISEVILDDIEGKLQSTSQPVNPRFVHLRVKNGAAPGLHAMVLKEYPDYIAVAPAVKDKPAHTVVSIYALNSVEITQR